MGRNVLVLNADFTPQRKVRPLKDALKLLYKKSAEVVEVKKGIKIRAGDMEFDCPSVIRVKKFHNVPRRGTKWNAREVLIRDNYTCIFCRKVLAKGEATIDHIYPKSRCKRDGIPYNTWTNTACACRKCQTRKSDKTIEECNMKLLWEPRTPRTNYIVISSDDEPEWRQYLEVKS